MPIRYRDEIRPRFHDWISEGYTHYANHKATAAGLELAQLLLDYKAPPQDGARYWPAHSAQGVVLELAAHGVTAKDILIRVAELAAFMEACPGRLKSQREEDFMLARNVIHLMPWSARGRRHGARVLAFLGELIREHTYAWALRFVRKLHEDAARKDALKRQAMDYS